MLTTTSPTVEQDAIGGLAAQGPALKHHLWAVLGYFVLALIVTYPAALHFTSAVPGDLIADRVQNLWNLWWIREAFGRLANPYHTDLLYYPYGVDLYYHTLGLPQGIMGLVPQLLWGLPAAYNTVLLLAFTLSGYGPGLARLLAGPRFCPGDSDASRNREPAVPTGSESEP